MGPGWDQQEWGPDVWWTNPRCKIKGDVSSEFPLVGGFGSNSGSTFDLVGKSIQPLCKISVILVACNL